MKRQFGSDNYSGICPEAWAALAEANTEHDLPYGDDEWTRRACDAVRDVFETECDVFFVFNGTAANSLALASLCQSYHSVLAHELAHVRDRRVRRTGVLLERDQTPAGLRRRRLCRPRARGRHVRRRSDIHYPKPRVLSLTQATEVGTVYSVAQVAAAGDLARHASG